MATEIAGASRYLTAVEASKRGFPSGATTAVVATGQNWPDALGGSALCGAVRGPLLLTAKLDVPTAVRSELVRLGAEHVYVLGSESAVSAAAVAELEDVVGAGNVERLGGASRYDTCARVASETLSVARSELETRGIVVTGRNYPDAVVAAPIAAANEWPIFMVKPDSVPPVILATMQSVGADHGHVIGGPAAVSDDVIEELNDAFYHYADAYSWRISGDTRYRTAAAVADAAYTYFGMYFTRPALATGQSFPDALAGGALQGSDYNPVVLTPKSSLEASASALLTEYRDMIYEIRFLGSTAALEQATRDAATGLLH